MADDPIPRLKSYVASAAFPVNRVTWRRTFITTRNRLSRLNFIGALVKRNQRAAWDLSLVASKQG